ncbi:metallophosphoesterase family protein [Pseudoneobacillus sp. C159]
MITGTKIGIISDIHGNASSLQAVLQELQANDISHIYCLGDTIGIGHETNEVLEQLTALKNISFVKGNHDLEVINVLNGLENSNDVLRDHHEWIANQVDPTFRSWLVNLPLTITEELEGRKFHFAHYHLDQNQTIMDSDTEPSLKKLESHYSDSLSSVICFGHHHAVHFFQSDQRIYINPGPVGIDNFGPLAKYAIIEIDETINVSFKQTKYDVIALQQFIAGFKTKQVPWGERLAGIYKY